MSTISSSRTSFANDNTRYNTTTNLSYVNGSSNGNINGLVGSPSSSRLRKQVSFINLSPFSESKIIKSSLHKSPSKSKMLISELENFASQYIQQREGKYGNINMSNDFSLTK